MTVHGEQAICLPIPSLQVQHSGSIFMSMSTQWLHRPKMTAMRVKGLERSQCAFVAAHPRGCQIGTSGCVRAIVNGDHLHAAPGG